MKKHNKPSPLKANFVANLVGGIQQLFIDTVQAATSVLNSEPRPEINGLCDVPTKSRPVFVLEKHMTVLRKGPTMPLTLEMHRTSEEVAEVNTNTEGAVIAANFLGFFMDNAANYCEDPSSGNCGGAVNVGTAIDGSDVSIFHDMYKEQLKKGDEIRIPVDINDPNQYGTQGQDWAVKDQLIIEHVYTDPYGNLKKAVARVEVINPAQNRDFDPANPSVPSWDASPWSPYNHFGCTQPTYDPLNDPPICANLTVGDAWTPERNFVLAKIMSMSGVFPKTVDENAIYSVSLVQIPPLFKVKFPRFSYRYKYQDGEYSIFAPWSEIAFIPKKFDFSPKKGYNLGMENDIRALKVLNWRPKDCPKDVVQIDILYKESNSPSVYTVETFKNDDPIVPLGSTPFNNWNTPGNGGHFGNYTIKTELIHQVVASNQMLRPWDNVPRKAKAQEITANRLIFANYLQQYDIEEIDLANDKYPVKPEFLISVDENFPWEDNDYLLGAPVKSLKSQRTYQMGVVYRDRYGRETPVLTSSSGSVEIGKQNAKLQNRLSVQLLNNAPYWAESYTFYIKETSNEYYNLAMDRWYDAEDGGVWLSFPSVERNKINEESNLILKKKHNSNDFTDFDVSYKVLSIKNNAPRFVKTDFKYWGALPIMLPPPGWGDVGNWDAGMLYPSGLPLPRRMNIDVIAEYFDQSVLQNLGSSSLVQVRIIQSPGVSSAYNAFTSEVTNTTKWYDVANISHIGAPPLTQIDVNGNEIEIPGQTERLVRIALETAFGEDAAFCESDSIADPLNVYAVNANLSMSRGLILEARSKEEKEKAQFEGRFFVKILRDSNIETNIVEAQQTIADDWQVLESKDIKYICAAHPGRQDWNWDSTYYIDPGVALQHYSNVLGNTSNNPSQGNFEVSSFGPNAANRGATYRNMVGGQFASGSTEGEPMTAPYWPFGPGEQTDGVYRPGGPNGSYWFNNYKQHLVDTIPSPGSPLVWPESAVTGKDWPSFPLGFWNPTNHWGNVSNNSEYLAIGTFSTVGGNNHYSHLDFSNYSGTYPKYGVLDLTQGYGPTANNGTSANQGTVNPNPTVTNFVSWVGMPDYDSSSGYMAGANPFQVPAIWGDQSDFLKNSTTCGENSGTWPDGCTPHFDVNTTTKLREDWYYLFHGRDKVLGEWPLGKFHPDRWFFDKVGAAGGYSGNGIWNDGNVSYMDLSYYGVGAEGAANRDTNTALMARSQPTEISFNDRMTTIGTQFRFKQDPDGVIYTITEVKTTENVWNYEAPQGRWASSEDNGTTIVGGDGLFKQMLPPWGGYSLETSLLGGKTGFISDIVNYNAPVDRAKLCGGAPYNRRIRHQLKLDKIIGQEGPNGFHPITNHVDENGKANIKRGRQKYHTNMVHVTTAKGGTPVGQNWYNLASYWNAADQAGGGNTTQPNDLSASFYTNNPNAYIGLHERGLNETTIEIVTRYTGRDKDFPISNNPAIWETEPKEDVGLDIYYAASPTFPLDIKRYRSDQNVIGHDLKTGPDEPDPSLANWYDFSYRGEELVKVGSTVETPGNSSYTSLLSEQEVRICTVQGDTIWFNHAFQNSALPGSPAVLPVTTRLRIKWQGEGRFYGGKSDEEYVEVFVTQSITSTIYKIGSQALTTATGKLKHGLGYYNCYAYGTGVETNRVRDDFNAVTIDKGVKASMPLAEGYKEERKESSLIFSGIYNSTSGINRTNQFIQAEPITKDLNPINGSIQKLYTRDTDLVTFCENKVFKILAQKDALFNADGNTNVTSNAQVLGQAIPFSGDYGISKNPESFASQSYRIYFTDKSRGAVMRLSKDGLTPISEAGMKDWFKDNLRFASKLIGSHDDREEQYNLTLETADQNGVSKAYTVSYTEKNRGWVSFKSFIQQGGISHKNIYYTFPSNTYNPQNTLDPWGVNYAGGGGSNAEMYQHNLDIEINRLVVSNVNGLGTFLIDDGVGTILPGMSVVGNGIPIDTTILNITGCDGITCSITLSFTNAGTTGVYLTASTELTFKTARNTFYDNTTPNYSMVKVLFNGNQGSVKRFKTLNYEGSQSRVSFGDASGLNYQIVEGVQFGQEYYDNHPKLGWYVENIFTDLQEGRMKEFIDKENKWFNYIKGYADAGEGDFLDSGEFSLQGLGYWVNAPGVIYGCIDPVANNYDATANADDGSCDYSISGCTDATAMNYNPIATTDDGSCTYCVYGCEDINAQNYDPLATCWDGSCVPYYLGCSDPVANNYNTGISNFGNSQEQANGMGPCGSYNLAGYTGGGEDGNCMYLGCTDPSAANYSWPSGVIHPYGQHTNCGGYLVTQYGSFGTVMTPTSHPLLFLDDGSCVACQNGCMDGTAYNYDPTATCDDGTCLYGVLGCTDPTACNYNPLATVDDGSCTGLFGCTNNIMQNYNPSATCDDGSCIPHVYGCMDAAAINFDCATALNPNSTVPCADSVTADDGSCITAVYGCTDPTAVNYDPSANSDDGSCVPCAYGCTNPSGQSNYDANATCDDGSCIPCIYGCTDVNAVNFTDLTATCDNGSCQPFVSACTDPLAVNYALSAHNMGNSQEQLNGMGPCGLYNAAGHTSGGETGDCLYGGCIDPNASNYLTFTDQYGTVHDKSSVGGVIHPYGEHTTCGGLFISTYGVFGTVMTETTHPSRFLDDGSCLYSGCTDPTAINYDSAATTDDGSCDYSNEQTNLGAGTTCTAGCDQLNTNFVAGDGSVHARTVMCDSPNTTFANQGSWSNNDEILWEVIDPSGNVIYSQSQVYPGGWSDGDSWGMANSVNPSASTYAAGLTCTSSGMSVRSMNASFAAVIFNYVDGSYTIRVTNVTYASVSSSVVNLVFGCGDQGASNYNPLTTIHTMTCCGGTNTTSGSAYPTC